MRSMEVRKKEGHRIDVIDRCNRLELPDRIRLAMGGVDDMRRRCLICCAYGASRYIKREMYFVCRYSSSGHPTAWLLLMVKIICYACYV